jgi:hypothetical protein
MAEVTKIRWWQWLPIFRWRVVAVAESADAVPVRLPRNGAVLVGSPSAPKWIAFDCPCGTGHRILLNTDKSRTPHWSATVRGRLTLFPSVDSNLPGKRCHFFIQNGRVVWAR